MYASRTSRSYEYRDRISQMYEIIVAKKLLIVILLFISFISKQCWWITPWYIPFHILNYAINLKKENYITQEKKTYFLSRHIFNL